MFCLALQIGQVSVRRSSELGVVERVSVEVLEVPFDRLPIVSVATSRHNDGILHDLHGDRAQELPHNFWCSLGSYPLSLSFFRRRSWVAG